MNIIEDAPLNVHYLKTGELQKIININAPLNVCNFKTRPPFDKWSVPYDRALQNTSFEKNDDCSAVCQRFSKKPR